MLLFHLKCLSLQTSTYNLGRAEWRTSKVSKPLPILFLPDDNFLIYSYILFSATFVKRQKQKSQHKSRNRQKGKRRMRCLTIILVRK